MDALNTMIQLAGSLQAEKDALKAENDALKKLLGNLLDSLNEEAHDLGKLKTGKQALSALDTLQANLECWCEELEEVLPPGRRVRLDDEEEEAEPEVMPEAERPEVDVFALEEELFGVPHPAKFAERHPEVAKRIQERKPHPKYGDIFAMEEEMFGIPHPGKFAERYPEVAARIEKAK